MMQVNSHEALYIKLGKEGAQAYLNFGFYAIIFF
jgi:hypothetical protein